MSRCAWTNEDTYRKIDERVARRGETRSQYLLRLVQEDLRHSA